MTRKEPQDLTEEIKTATEKERIREREKKKLVRERNKARSIAEQLFHRFLISVLLCHVFQAGLKRLIHLMSV